MQSIELFKRYARREASQGQGNFLDLLDPASQYLAAQVFPWSFPTQSSSLKVSGTSPKTAILFNVVYLACRTGTWALKDACILGYPGSPTWRLLCLSYRETSPTMAFRPTLSGQVRVVFRVRSARVAYHYIGLLGPRHVRSSFSTSTAIKSARSSVNN